jgi:hypothetical protein
MNIEKFQKRFNQEVLFKVNELQKISNIPGTNSALTQHTLNLAVSCLQGTDEAYLEIGCLNGSSLDAASSSNDNVIKYAVDTTVPGSLRELINNRPNLTFHQGDYFELNLNNFLKNKIGCYFYDGSHERDATYDALEKVIPHLADRAIIFVDDLYYNRVYNAYREFIRKHSDQFTIVHEFWPPDQFRALTEGYLNDFWDGWAIVEFERKFSERDESVESIAIARWHRIGEYSNKPKVLYPEELKHIHGREEEPV